MASVTVQKLHAVELGVAAKVAVVVSASIALIFAVSQLAAGELGTNTFLAINSSVCLLAGSTSTLLQLRNRSREVAFGQVTGLAVMAIALIALVGWMYGFSTLYDFGGNKSLSAPLALIFLLSGTVLFFWRSDKALAASLLADSAGGKLAKRLLPAALVVPLLLGWLRIKGQQAGFYDPETGLLIFVFMTTIIFSALILRYANLQNREELRRREVEAALREKMNELAALNSELKSFSYSISHDLRAPLNRVTAFIELLKAEVEQLSATGEEYLERILKTTTKMREQVDAMLILAQVDQSELDKTSVDLSAVVREWALLSEKNGGQGVNFKIADHCQVIADPLLTKVLIDNLLSNACKFSREDIQPVVEFGALEDGSGKTFFVRDNGTGFAESEAEKIFAPFKRGQNAIAKGSGIGLATAKRIAHRHDGEIWAEGELNHGATFYFKL